MNEREKLIELLQEANTETSARIEMGEITDSKIGWEFLADHLLANGVTVQRWIPVTERLPEESAWVICKTVGPYYEVLRWVQETQSWWGDLKHEYMKGYITHWMPLPIPPKEEE